MKPCFHLKSIVLAIVLIYVVILSGCSKYHDSVHAVQGMNAIYYTLMPSQQLTKDKFEYNKFKSEYFDNRSDNGCSGKSLGTDVLTAKGPAIERLKFYLPKSFGLDYRSAAIIAYDNKFVTSTQLYKIQCIRMTVYGKQNNINYTSNTVDVPVVCGGECPDHCGCLPYGGVEYKKFYFMPIKS